MSRRGRSGPTISLFSFQDIITSVTAIVTVITLLLALDLVQRKESQASDSSASLVVELINRLENAEAELAQLRKVADSTDELLSEVAETSPAELRNEIAQRELMAAELEREKSRREKQAKVSQTREKEELTKQFDLEPLKHEREKVDRDANEVERQRAEEKAENRTVFSLPRGMRKDGWLAVIDAQKISVAPLGKASKPVTFIATGLPLIGSSAADNFKAWFLEQRLTSDYFLLLIRPDGASLFDTVQTKLEENKVAHGFDLISAEQSILHPERGAIP